MLTGDNYLATQLIARQAGIDELYAELKPEDNTRKVTALDQQYGRAAMVGDGINDARPPLMPASPWVRPAPMSPWRQRM